jgi:exodeoxyribonuclease VII large subunit
MAESDYISLYKLNEYIRQVVEINFDEWIKIKAELNQVSESRGHYYIELVEKDPETDEILARQSAVLWRNNATFLRRKYGSLFEDLLSAGNEIVFSGRVEFHPKYGLKLVIQDLDADYTLGELERKKRAVLNHLIEQDLLDVNKHLFLSPAIQRIAVVSSRTAAGYADFINQLTSNPYGHAYQIDLYHSAVQGVAAVDSIVTNLNQIFARSDIYDAVCIMRGGGSKLDLSAFDELAVALAITESPIPVITGIGHEVDTSIADMVAHSAVKTPTAVAAFILHHNEAFLDEVWNLSNEIVQRGKLIVTKEQDQMRNMSFRMHAISERYFSKQAFSLERLHQDLLYSSRNWFQKAHAKLDQSKLKLNHLRPDNILKRGYSITLINNKVLTNTDDVKNGDEIKSILYTGELISEVKNKNDGDEDDL